MTYLAIIATLLLIAVCADTGILVYLLRGKMARRSKEKTDEKVEQAEEERRKDKAFDEGFENIMRFSVNGKTGFEMNE